jgi:sulfite oxidase
MGNGRWRGVSLRELLLSLGVRDEHVGPLFRHVEFEGADEGRYATSIPADVAMDPRRSVLLAFEYDGEPLSRDHGFPLRAVVPGVVAARQVKWLRRVSLRATESESAFTKRDYKAFASSMDARSVDYDSMPAMMDMPVTSAFAEPAEGARVPPGAASVAARGWAWAGGGRGIARVDVSGDGGRTFAPARITRRPPDDSPSMTQSFGWTLWEAEVPVRGGAGGEAELCVKAVDSALNCQPESEFSQWNFRGIATNAWHRVRVKLE